MNIDISVLVTVAIAVIVAWWAIAKMFISQFEKRQNERFDNLEQSITAQKRELDGHMTRQDQTISEIRRVENELARCQVDAATRYQTKHDASNQFGQLIIEIRGLGSRIDALHGRSVGLDNGRTQ